MTELRWVLLAFGVLIIAAIYFWDRGISRHWHAFRSRTKARHVAATNARVEPELDSIEIDIPDEVDEKESPVDDVSTHDPEVEQKIVTLRVIPGREFVSGSKVILALRAAGLRHGKYGIFHAHMDALNDEILFSVASLTEPGSFDLTKLAETAIPGMSFFMLVPVKGDPVERFDRMIATARKIARELEGELRDENGSSWSIQRERYVREEIIQHLHSVDKPRLN